MVWSYALRCHNHTFVNSKLAIVQHLLLTTSESSQFVFASMDNVCSSLAPFENKDLENGAKRFFKASLKVRTREYLKAWLYTYKQKTIKRLK